MDSVEKQREPCRPSDRVRMLLLNTDKVSLWLVTTKPLQYCIPGTTVGHDEVVRLLYTTVGYDEVVRPSRG